MNEPNPHSQIPPPGGPMSASPPQSPGQQQAVSWSGPTTTIAQESGTGMNYTKLWQNVALLAIGILILGAIFSSSSGITFRPTQYNNTNYTDQLEAKNEKSSFIYMLGIVFVDAGLLLLGGLLLHIAASDRLPILVRFVCACGALSSIVTAGWVMIAGPLLRFTAGA
ncbi:MAG: hypothetical protein QW728_00790 [Thermoplasmata archaeon]